MDGRTYGRTDIRTYGHFSPSNIIRSTYGSRPKNDTHLFFKNAASMLRWFKKKFKESYTLAIMFITADRVNNWQQLLQADYVTYGSNLTRLQSTVPVCLLIFGDINPCV